MYNGFVAILGTGKFSANVKRIKKLPLLNHLVYKLIVENCLNFLVLFGSKKDEKLPEIPAWAKRSLHSVALHKLA